MTKKTKLQPKNIEDVKRELIARYMWLYENKDFILAPYIEWILYINEPNPIDTDSVERIIRTFTNRAKMKPLNKMLAEFLLSDTPYKDSKFYQYIEDLKNNPEQKEEREKRNNIISFASLEGIASISIDEIINGPIPTHNEGLFLKLSQNPNLGIDEESYNRVSNHLAELNFKERMDYLHHWENYEGGDHVLLNWYELPTECKKRFKNWSLPRDRRNEMKNEQLEMMQAKLKATKNEDEQLKILDQTDILHQQIVADMLSANYIFPGDFYIGAFFENIEEYIERQKGSKRKTNLAILSIYLDMYLRTINLEDKNLKYMFNPEVDYEVPEGNEFTKLIIERVSERQKLLIQSQKTFRKIKDGVITRKPEFIVPVTFAQEIVFSEEELREIGLRIPPANESVTTCPNCQQSHTRFISEMYWHGDDVLIVCPHCRKPHIITPEEFDPKHYVITKEEGTHEKILELLGMPPSTITPGPSLLPKPKKEKPKARVRKPKKTTE